jgi:hypothetical protein
MKESRDIEKRERAFGGKPIWKYLGVSRDGFGCKQGQSRWVFLYRLLAYGVLGTFWASFLSWLLSVSLNVLLAPPQRLY